MQFDDRVLYEHNIEAYKKLMSELDNKNKVCAIHSTGTGKMYIALKWLIDNKNEPFAYVAPTNVILDKFLDIIINNLLEDKKESLNECKTIEQRVKKVENLLGSNIHLLTYQGINESIKRGKIDLMVNRIVLDEFHHCGADKWGDSVKEFLKINSESKVLGLSATPIRMDGKNMVQEMFEGKIDSEITLKQSLETGILPIPNFIGAIYSFEEEIQKLEKKMLSKRISIKTKEMMEKYLKEAKKIIEDADGIKEVFDVALQQVENPNNVKFIVFCSNLEDKENKIEECKKWFGLDKKINIRTVDYKKTKKENLKIIKEFEEDKSDEIKLLFSIDMLNEGLHVEDIDGVIMMRPTESDIIFSQQLGRALASGHKKGLKPLVLDLVNNIDNLNKDLETIQFIKKYDGKIYGGISEGQLGKFSIQAKVLNILQYLKSYSYSFDERIYPLVCYFKEKGTIGKIKYKEIFVCDGEKVNVGLKISNLRAEYKLREIDKKDLKKYKEKNKITYNPLTDEQVQILESMGMVWQKTGFSKRIEPLVAYYEEKGTLANIVANEIYVFNGEKINIGEKIMSLRKEYKLRNISKDKYDELQNIYKISPLTDEEVEILEEMGMVWTKKKSFFERVEPLIAYYKEKGTLSTIVSDEIYIYKGKEVNIDSLMSNLLTSYKLSELSDEELENRRKSGKFKSRALTEEEVQYLSENTDIFNQNRSFLKRIAPLIAYYKQNGSIGYIKEDLKYSYNGEEVNLGGIVRKLRTAYNLRFASEERIQKAIKEKQKILTDQEVRMLEDMGMIFNLRKSKIK